MGWWFLLLASRSHRASHVPQPDAAAPHAGPHRRRPEPGGGGHGSGGGGGGGRGGVRGGGPDGAVRAVRGRARAGVGEEGVPRVRPGGGHRGGLEPRAAARAGGPRPRHGRPPPRRGAPPPLAPPRAHHRLPQGLARPRRRRAQLHHRGLHLRQPPRVPPPPPPRLRQGAQEVGAPDPPGPPPPPHPRPLHHPPRPQLQQRLHQWQHRPGQDRRPRAGGDRGQDPRGAHDPGHAGVHGAGAVHGDVHGVGGRLLVRHVRAGDGDAGDALRRVRERRADLPQRHPRRAPRGAPAAQGPRDARLHRALHWPAPEPPHGGRAPARPLLQRYRRRQHRHARLAAPATSSCPVWSDRAKTCISPC